MSHRVVAHLRHLRNGTRALIPEHLAHDPRVHKDIDDINRDLHGMMRSRSESDRLMYGMDAEHLTRILERRGVRFA